MNIPLTLYDWVVPGALGAGLGLTGLRLALLADSYTFDAAHQTWAEVSAHEISGGNYPAGGQALGGGLTGATFFAAGNLTTFAELEATFAYGVLVSTADKLVGCLIFNAGAAISVTGYDFKVTWADAGVIKAEKL